MVQTPVCPVVGEHGLCAVEESIFPPCSAWPWRPLLAEYGIHVHHKSPAYNPCSDIGGRLWMKCSTVSRNKPLSGIHVHHKSPAYTQVSLGLTATFLSGKES